MKLTKRQLKQLIKEELAGVLGEDEGEYEIFQAVRDTATEVASLGDDIAGGLTTEATPEQVREWSDDIVTKGNYLRHLSEKLEELQGPMEPTDPLVDAP